MNINYMNTPNRNLLLYVLLKEVFDRVLGCLWFSFDIQVGSVQEFYFLDSCLSRCPPAPLH